MFLPIQVIASWVNAHRDRCTMQKTLFTTAGSWKRIATLIQSGEVIVFE